MAPSSVTEDYYMVLEVEQTATLELIVRSYKRLALKLHPDRNAKHDATEAFQLILKLGRAYETLKDERKRQTYDLVYPFIARSRPSPQTTQTPRPPPASVPRSDVSAEALYIASLQKSKQERASRWWTKKIVFDSTIFEMQRAIRQLEREIRNLESIAAAEAAVEAQKNSWGTWLLSPIYKKAEDEEEEKARKDRERQERRIEKDMKERRLELKKAGLAHEENLLKKAKEELDGADWVDDERIRAKERDWQRFGMRSKQQSENDRSSEQQSRDDKRSEQQSRDDTSEQQSKNDVRHSSKPP
ncbi:hypothetical protein MBLNU459_g8149t1 [Dothideomycetes sp. NU459]